MRVTEDLCLGNDMVRVVLWEEEAGRGVQEASPEEPITIIRMEGNEGPSRERWQWERRDSMGLGVRLDGIWQLSGWV